jgi:hypothetical protein
VHNALDETGLAPPIRELPGADLAGARWTECGEIDWVLLISSGASENRGVVRKRHGPGRTAKLRPSTAVTGP